MLLVYYLIISLHDSTREISHLVIRLVITSELSALALQHNNNNNNHISLTLKKGGTIQPWNWSK